MIIASSILLALLVGYLTYRHLDWGVYIVLACLPAYGLRFTLGGIPFTLLEFLILTVVAVWLWRRPAITPIGTTLGLSSLRWAMIAVVVMATMAVFVATDWPAAAGYWKAYFIEPILFAIVFISTIKTADQFRRVVWALAVPATAISLFAIFQYLAGGFLVPVDYWLGGEGQRVTSFYSYPNAIGLFVAPIIGLLIGLLVDRWHAKQWPAVLVSCLVIISGMIAIILAKSDGALVALVAALFIALLITRYTRWPTIILLILGGVFVAWQSFPSSISDVLLLRDWSGQVRLTMWSETWQLIKDHWLLGVGLGGYQTAMIPYHSAKHLEIFLYPHNILFNFWVEIGLAGMLVFLGMLFAALRHTAYAIRHTAYGIGILMAVVILVVHGLVDVPYFKNDLAVLWWVVIALAYES